MAANFFNRVKEILGNENVDYEPKVVAEVLQKYFPDFRRTLNELQRYSSTGKIDTGILGVANDIQISNLVKYLRGKEFTNMKKWVTQNLDNELRQS